MEKLLVIDGNSIVNRAFYGIMGNKMLQTADGTYTNAVYGFLAILFKELDEIKPDYIAVAFDLKAPTARHKLYEGYKANRKGMPDELASQMPILKNILNVMNITIIEKEGYEADDILGTLSVKGENAGLQVAILTGDRDSFQLATDKVKIYLPRTKAGKTETDIYDKTRIISEYGVEPKQMIEVKGLQGDSSDNIPGVPGIGEKTALSIIKEYGSIENLYNNIENETDGLKGKTREKIAENKELAILSKTLGTINLQTPIEETIEELKIKEWNKPEVLKIFKELRFKRFIDRFDLENSEVKEDKTLEQLFEYVKLDDVSSILEKIKQDKVLYYYFEKNENSDVEIIKKKIGKINIYIKSEKKVYNLNFDSESFKEIFENPDILKCGYQIKEDYILLKQENIDPKNMMYDARIAMYLLNSNTNLYSIEEIANQYMDIDLEQYYSKNDETEDIQTSFFDNETQEQEKENYKFGCYAYIIGESKNVLEEKLKEINELDLFQNIEMPCTEILAEMQFTGVFVDKDEIKKMSEELKIKIELLSKEIYELAGIEFNINSPKQLGEILFEKLELPYKKKNKNGYSTDVDTLEALKKRHPIIEKILTFRQISKLNSTFVEGMLPYINEKTNRIHTSFHQTVTATGRLSSSDPNLQNIPTRTELGKQIRKLFKAEDGKVFIDADYSQIELRVLAHMSKDENMINAFRSHSDIHKISASQVFGVPLEEVTKEMRSHAKAVNFGIVYGISDFGLSEQLGISMKEAKKYIEAYLENYKGIQIFMDEEKEFAKRNGYVETLYHRRRYIPELSSNNFMVRKFGDRAAMNAPIQGTAADIMKIAMINVYKKLNEKNLQSKIVLQIHDELIIETAENEIEEVSKILRSEMENAAKLSVALDVDLQIGRTWYDTK